MRALAQNKGENKLGYENDAIFGMESYFSSYRKRFPHKSLEDAIRATRNWAEGSNKAFRGDSLEPATSEKIEKRLNELRLQDRNHAYLSKKCKLRDIGHIFYVG